VIRSDYRGGTSGRLLMASRLDPIPRYGTTGRQSIIVGDHTLLGLHASCVQADDAFADFHSTALEAINSARNEGCRVTFVRLRPPSLCALNQEDKDTR
jgi:hypothetical protein